MTRHDANETTQTDAQRLTEFALLVSRLLHELRTPLGSIAGGASVLEQYGEKLDEAARSRICSGIVGQTSRLDSLFTALAALARSRTGTLVGERQAVEMNEVLRGSWAVDRNSGGAAGTISLLRDEVFVDTDPAVIRTVITLMLGLTAILVPEDDGPGLSLVLEKDTAVVTVECNTREGEGARLEKLLTESVPEALARPDVRTDAICLAAIREVVHSLGGQFGVRHDAAGGQLRQTIRLKTGNVSAALDKS